MAAFDASISDGPSAAISSDIRFQIPVNASLIPEAGALATIMYRMQGIDSVTLGVVVWTVQSAPDFAGVSYVGPNPLLAGSISTSGWRPPP